MRSNNVKTVKFGGIERVNTRINCNEGACEEIIDLRPDGNTWKNMGERKSLSSLAIDSTLYGDDLSLLIHPVSKEKYAIIWDKTTGKVYLYNKTDNTYKALSDGTSNITDATSVSYLDNVLIVCTATQKYYFLYNVITNSYKFIDLQNTRLEIECTSNPALAETDDDYAEEGDESSSAECVDANLYLDAVDSETVLYSWNLYGTVLVNRTTSSTVHYDTIRDCVRAMINDKAEYYNTEESDCFAGMSFYRVALRMYDGSYINFSNVGYANTNGEDMVNLGSSLNYYTVTMFYTEIEAESTSQGFQRRLGLDKMYGYNIFGTHTLKVFCDRDKILSLFDDKIIQSVDVFMTRPIYSFDMTENHQMRIEGKWDDNTKPVKAVLPLNIDGIEEAIKTGVYYKVKSFNRDKFSDLTYDSTTGACTFNIVRKDLTGLEGNETMKTPTTDNTILSDKTYLYNNKLHDYNVVYKIFKGYSLRPGYNATPSTNFLNTVRRVLVAQGSGITSDTPITFEYIIEGKYNNKFFSVKHEIGSPDDFFTATTTAHNASFATAILHLPKFFNYPMIESLTFKIVLCIINNKNEFHSVLYEKTYNNIHASGNENMITVLPSVEFSSIHRKAIGGSRTSSGASPVPVYYKGVYNGVDRRNNVFIYEDIDVESSLNAAASHYLQEKNLYTQIDTIESNNVLQLSGTDNPFVYPNEDNYSFGSVSNMIRAVEATVGQMSESKFGQFPLYVFTDEGVYTMAVGNGNVSYSNIAILNNSKIKTDSKTISTPYGVIFLSMRGLELVNGRDMSCLTELVKGNPSLTLKPENDSLTANTDDILSEIAKSEMYYDQTHQELNVICSKYTYVYNLQYQCWYKRSDSYNTVNSETLMKKATETDGSTVKYMLKTYSMDEDAAKSKPYILTKPILLDTRQQKRVERFIYDMQYKDSDEMDVMVYTSNNGVDYRKQKSYQKAATDGTKTYQDMYFSRMLNSAKYLVFALSGSNWDEARIANIMLEFREERNREGIR